MAWIVRALLPELLLSLLVSSTLGQSIPNSKPVSRFLLANVIDAQGNAIDKLSKESFHLRVNGKPATIVGANYNRGSRRIVVLLDMSGSMTEGIGPEKWQIAREAVTEILHQTPAETPIAMVTFDGKARDVLDFSHGRSAIASWLNDPSTQRPHLKYPAKTALFDSLLEALRLLGPVEKGDSIVAITDGGDNASKESFAQIEELLLRSQVRLFTFLFSDHMPVSQEENSYNSFLQLVDDSGGHAFGIVGHPFPNRASWETQYSNGNEVRDRMRVTAQILRIMVDGYWILETEAPVTEKKRNKINLTLSFDTEKERKNAVITYSLLLPSSAQQQPATIQ